MKLSIPKFTGALAVLSLCTAAFAQQYPTKPIRLVLPFAAGSGTDHMARVLAPAVSRALGQPIIIDNKAGADGLISGQEVMRAAPDGYTLLIGNSGSLSAVPAMKKVPPYDVINDFTPITDIGRYAPFLVVDSDLPVKTLPELIAYAKKNPGKLNYGSGSTGNIVSFAQIIALSGMDVVHVPYKGEAAAMTDLLGGRVQMMLANLSAAMPHIQSGRIRALAVALARRVPPLLDVPTIAEAGLPQFNIKFWAGLFGPAKMPRDIVMRLNREFGLALRNPEIIESLQKQGFQVTSSTPEELAALVKDQLGSYTRILRAAGVQPE